MSARVRTAAHVALIAACLAGPLTGAARGAEDAVKQARKLFIVAMRKARLERWAAPAGQAVDHVLEVARRLESTAALDLVRDVAVATPHPYQRVQAVRRLTSLRLKTPEPMRRTALRIAEAAREVPLDIRPTSFVTPNWSVQEAAMANASMAEALRDWFANEILRRPDETQTWFKEVIRHERAVARLGLASAVVQELPAWARRTARLRMTADKVPAVRAMWIEAVALYDETQSVSHILRQSLSKHAILRDAAVRALDLLAPDDPGVRTRFLKGFGSGSAVEVALAAREAGRQQSDATSGKLWKTLESPYWEARAQAVASLGLVRTRRSVEVLVRALPTMGLDMQARCMRSLRRLTGLDLGEVEAWQGWWQRNTDFRPSPEEAAGAVEPEVRGRVEGLPPEGRRFVVYCFLPTAKKPSLKQAAGLGKLFFDLASAVDEEGAVGIRCGGWWSIKGDKAKKLTDPSRRVPNISSRSVGRSRGTRTDYDWPPKGPVIPYLDPVEAVLKVARKKLGSMLGYNVRSSEEALWQELAAVLGGAETETICLLASRDVSAEAAARFQEQLRRLRWAATGRPIRLRMAHYGEEEPKRLAALVESLGGAWMTRRPEIPEAKPRKAEEGAPQVTADTGWIDDRKQAATEDWAPAGDIGRARVQYSADGEITVEVEPAHAHTWHDVVLRVYLDLDDASATKGHGPGVQHWARANAAWSKAKEHAWFGADAFLGLRLMSGGVGQPPHLNHWGGAMHGKADGTWDAVERSYEDGRIRVTFNPSGIGVKHPVTRTLGLRLELDGVNVLRFQAPLPAAPKDIPLDRLPGFRPQTTRVPVGRSTSGPTFAQGLQVDLFAMRRGDLVAWRVHADPHTSGWDGKGDLSGLLSTLLEMPKAGRAGHWLGRASVLAPAAILDSQVNAEDQTFLMRFPGAAATAKPTFMIRFETTDRWPDSPAGGVRLVRPR